MTDLTPSAPPDREGYWYGLAKLSSFQKQVRPMYVDNRVIHDLPNEWHWFGPVPTAQEWHDTKAQLAALWAMKKPSPLAEIDAAIARLQRVREELL